MYNLDIRNYFKSNGLFKNAIAAFLMKILAALFGFLLNVVLARQLGAEGTGIFYLALSCASIAILVSQFGMGQSLLRFIATSVSQEDWQAIKGVTKISQWLCLSTSGLVSITVFLAAPFIASHIFHKDVLISYIQIITFAIIPSSLFVLKGYSLQALGKIKASIFINGVSVAMLASFSMLILIPLFGLKGAVFSFVIASWGTCFFSFYFWHKYTPSFSIIRSSFRFSTLLKSNLPLFWVSLSQLVMGWSSSIMLGMWVSEGHVGLFSIANKTALLISFILSCVNTVIAPQFAALYHQGNTAKLQSVAISATMLMMILATPLVIVIVSFPELIMSMFGSQFIEAAPVLVVLSIGQFLYVVTGSVGFLLTMSGHETVMRNIMISCSALLILLNFLLIPRLGVLGAGIATSITLVVQNVIISIAVWKIIGIIGIPFWGTRYQKNND